jgi:hypothetical protein
MAEVISMKKTLAFVFAAVSVLALSSTSQASAPETQEADVGSCYSARPICIGTSPVCVCNYSMQCFWACR